MPSFEIPDDESPHHRKIPKLSEETRLQIVEKLSGAEIYVEQLLREAKSGEWKIISGNSDPIVSSKFQKFAKKKIILGPSGSRKLLLYSNRVQNGSHATFQRCMERHAQVEYSVTCWTGMA